jgi:hypothetical protein
MRPTVQPSYAVAGINSSWMASRVTGNLGAGIHFTGKGCQLNRSMQHHLIS